MVSIASREIAVRRKQHTAKRPQYEDFQAVRFQNRKMRARIWIAFQKNNSKLFLMQTTFSCKYDSNGLWKRNSSKCLDTPRSIEVARLNKHRAVPPLTSGALLDKSDG
jgi:hypothetical protein